MARLKVHFIDSANHANGPGTRFTIWLQGCSIGCPACFNPATHNPANGYWMTVEDLLLDIRKHLPETDGLTISGGEPLDQADALFQFLSGYHKNIHLPVILFSGYTYQQILADQQKSALRAYLDVLISGPYDPAKAAPGHFPASENQQIIFLSKTYTEEDMQVFLPAEIIISPEGEIFSSGIDPFLCELI
jgi:anaerobic ribonucleoside-triphosphate reductase activating protein